MKYDSRLIRRRTQSTLRQLKNYIEKGLLREEILTNLLSMDDDDLEKLYHIKMLIEVGFTLDQIKIIIDDIDNSTLLSIFDHYIDGVKKSLDIFTEKYNMYKINNLISLENRDFFGFFKSEVIARTVMFELYENRHIWYKSEENKKIVKSIRKNIFLSFANFKSDDEPNEQAARYFSELYNFLIINKLDKSPLYFICWMRWLTTEPRYVKEMKRITKFNYGNEIFECALKWVVRAKSKKY